MNIKVILLLICVLAQGVMDEAWSRDRYDLGHEWTAEEALADMVIRFRYAPDMVKFREVNRFFNQMPYHGDVAGYALAKKQALIEMDVEPHRLQLAHVKHRRSQDDLIVLLVYPEMGGEDALVLDSFFPGISLLSEREDLFLVLTLDDEEVDRLRAQ